jgi:hypothetical protein
MHWRNPQRQTPRAVRSGPTATKIWLAMVALLMAMWLATAVLA